MTKYRVEIQVTSTRYEDIEASNGQEALELVQEKLDLSEEYADAVAVRKAK